MVIHPSGGSTWRYGFAGLRLSADEFFALPDDGNRYELIDGVVNMSPSPSADHQRTAKRVYEQLSAYVESRGLGEVFYEIDVHLGRSPDGRDIVYRPDVVCFLGSASNQVRGQFSMLPAVAVEVVSADSTHRDLVTKRHDYERFGVLEYWLIDPVDARMTFFRLVDGKFVEAPSTPAEFESTAISGFRLDLNRIRSAFRAIGG